MATARAVVEATLETLLAVPGFGPARAKAVRAAATQSLEEASPALPPAGKAKKKAAGKKKEKKGKK